jgi:hypothetical protein
MNRRRRWGLGKADGEVKRLSLAVMVMLLKVGQLLVERGALCVRAQAMNPL